MGKSTLPAPADLAAEIQHTNIAAVAASYGVTIAGVRKRLTSHGYMSSGEPFPTTPIIHRTDNLALRPPPGDAETPCAGRWDLFDSTHQADHDEAREICAKCPVLDWCGARTAILKEDRSHGRPLTGTWAGVLYGLDARKTA